MELREIIEKAEAAAGSQKALGLLINQAPSHIRNAKAGSQGLPTYACIQIANLIDVPEITVIAASELVTEKRAERRAIFAPFVGRAAGVVIGALTLLNMSPKPANADTVRGETSKIVYYVKSSTKRKQLKEWLLKKRQLNIFKIRLPEAILSTSIFKIHKMTTQ